MTVARSAPVAMFGAYEINLNGYANIGTHWIPCFLKQILIVLVSTLFQRRLQNL